MAGPLEDTSLGEAQKEIHRRLLRQEKLKRIEQEEIRRLAAMDWQPPIERTPAGGPSVHNAADAIEETERRRRAYAQEARRRAEARQNDPIATRDRSEVRRREADRQDTGRKLDEIEGEWREVVDMDRNRDLTYSADSLAHYLDRSGKTIYYTPEELRAFDIVRDAEKGVQKHFEDWMVGPLSNVEIVTDGDTIGYKETPVDVNRLAPKLLALRDGETIRERDFWEKRFAYPWDYATSGLDWGKYMRSGRSDVDLFGFAGNAKLVGDGGFSFARKGDRIEFRGLVDHVFDEPYNFEAGTSFWKPYALGPLDRIYGDDGLLLAQHGRAAEYRMKSTWPQQAKGTLRIEPDGKLSLESVEWTDMDPNELHPWP